MIHRKRKLIDFKTNDGFLVHSLLTTGEYSNKEKLDSTPLVLIVHGVMGNFLSRGTPSMLPKSLTEHGINSFAINSRMAYLGQISGYGIFDDGIIDIDSAINKIKGIGYKNVFILGYSLGANLVASYASKINDRIVKGVILEGCAYSIPESQKRRLKKWNSIPSYDEIYIEAKKILSPDPYYSKRDRNFIIYRAWGSSISSFHSEVYTYKTWWFMRGPEARSSRTNELISEIKKPILFLKGESDHLVETWEVEKLIKHVKEAGNSKVKMEAIQKARHDCMENPGDTVRKIVDWIYSIVGF